MNRTLVLAAAALLTLAVSTPSVAAPCRDAKGKFIKCPAASAPAKPTKCKDAKGKFAKCGTPGAKPI
ncbi:hypothetical protein [Caulobacter sp. SSI4214]|uniref:hypothetical protein n=1 Tax=Caulobacter sp. SSI4214 TaxID=2575739 RepID=UPI001438E3EF|nr:hypothetical protein [Caulobacter sp. SSI4214]